MTYCNGVIHGSFNMGRRLVRKRTQGQYSLFRYTLGLVGFCAVVWGSRRPEELLELVDNIQNINGSTQNLGASIYPSTDKYSGSDRKLQNWEPSLTHPCDCETKCNNRSSNELPMRIAADVSSTVKTQRWDDWPAIAYEEVGHPLVTKGDNIYHHARELYLEPTNPERAENKHANLLDEFLEVYKARPDPVNMCGIRINHAMALYLAVKKIQPTLVVESGVNQGVSTYFIRAASPTTKIFAIDPKEQPICKQGKRWIDPSELTTNLTGENFVDLLELDWKGMIERREIEPERTLVFIDDHLHAFQRIAGVMKHGVRHVIVEDNYKYREGATSMDKRSTPKQYFHAIKFRTEANWLFRNTKSYAEFPPLIPPIMAKANVVERKAAGGFMVAQDLNKDIVHPILRPDTNEGDLKLYNQIAAELGLDPRMADDDSYMQFMNYNQICYLELLPVPRMLLE